MLGFEAVAASVAQRSTILLKLVARRRSESVVGAGSLAYCQPCVGVSAWHERRADVFLKWTGRPWRRLQHLRSVKRALRLESHSIISRHKACFIVTVKSVGLEQRLLTGIVHAQAVLLLLLLVQPLMMERLLLIRIRVLVVRVCQAATAKVHLRVAAQLAHLVALLLPVQIAADMPALLLDVRLGLHI